MMANTSDASLWRPKKGGLLQRTGGRCVKQLIGWHRTLQMHLFGPTRSRKHQTGGQCGRCCVERPLRTAAKRTRRRRAPSWPWSKRTMLTRKTCSTFNSRRSLQSIANSKLFLKFNNIAVRTFCIAVCSGAGLFYSYSCKSEIVVWFWLLFRVVPIGIERTWVLFFADLLFKYLWGVVYFYQLKNF